MRTSPTVSAFKPRTLKILLRAQLATFPGRLKFARAALTGAALIFCGLSYVTYADVLDATRTVGRDTVPSIVAAEKIRATLADANANMVNFFLASERDDGASWTAYQREMNEVQKNLLIAAQNITFGDEERVPILAMMTNLVVYERLVGQARALQQGDFRPDVVAAGRLMRQAILPNALTLDRANFHHLKMNFNTHQNQFALHAAAMIVSGLILLGLLAATQIHLARSTRRIINPGLAVASIALLVFAGYAALVLPRAEATLKSAKQDAFDSVHALWQARAVAYDANADESFYMLDHGNPGQEQRTSDFAAKTQLLLADDLESALRNAKQGARLKGYLGDALANISYPGEKELAMEMLTTWAAYMRIDKQIRELEETGFYKAALELNIGVKPGQSNWAFAQFDEALGKTLELNQRQFDVVIQYGFGQLANFAAWLCLTLLALVLAIIAGLKARIDEYRF